MAKNRIIFDPEDLIFISEKEIKKLSRGKILLLVFISLILAVVFSYSFINIYGSPRSRSYDKRIQEYYWQLALENRKLEQLKKEYTKYAQINNNIYRNIFGMNPLVINDTDTNNSFNIKYDLLSYPALAKQVYEQSYEALEITRIYNASYDTILKLSQQKDLLMRAMPIIMPVDRRRISIRSGFGWRRDPFTKGYRFHQGLDLAGRIGTPIYATADGLVLDPYANSSMSGYGKVVVINHGFGYQTLYGHLSKILVKPGDKVKRGQIIGHMGSTGRSKGPHLHYEIHYKGTPVNPINYLYFSLSPDEYQDIINEAEKNKEALS
ncbi:MAG TPA: M23 family metallopeptidase [Bacteroidales bacterium]|jgi:murein DD-endopeptidase MepM/ murein hydrolase activator NlpD|nr:M23 family metallopeptidase [Bacteroidales bacterium]HPL02439.1 M23 family metallopeptidase [Bacteroidales bacterium]HQH59033.1 M23 family metallopeptidase [Bacteroidales bacterium]HRR52414.1 M23 family metallopeptidase [Bacteroidales bacterium]HRT72436.1 M23 family metallopeptidase [Bacteroidales bacterium]